MTELRAILYDLDGTLVHTIPDITAALNRVRPGGPSVTEDRVALWVGGGARSLVNRFLAETLGSPSDPEDVEAMATRFLDDYARNVLVDTRPFPGALEALASFQAMGVAQAICTNKPRQQTHLLLESLDMLRYFGSVRTAERSEPRKPDPWLLHRALEDLGVDAAHAVMVGDSILDVQAARNAGLPAIVTAWGYRPEEASELGADRILHEFEELPEVLRNLGFEVPT